jgi:hypothetical protein
MTSLFWNNLEDARIKAQKERKTIEKDCNLPNNAFTQGIKRGSSPSADLAYLLAKAVGLTMEELVAGETGAEYVHKTMRNDPRAIQVPDRIYPIVECLLVLSDRDLSGILANVQTLARDKKGTHTTITGDTSEIAG